MEEYDYKKLRQRILKSWNRETKEETENEDAAVSVENKNPEPPYNEEGEKLKTVKTVKGFDDFLVKKENNNPSGRKEENQYTALLLKDDQLETAMEENGRKEDRRDKIMTDMARDWVIYDAIFNCPRFKSPWKPFRK